MRFSFRYTLGHMVKRILVTGGAGFLGSHLCDRLVSMGHDVVCLDNLFTSQKSNIEHLLGQKNFEFVRHDITEPIMHEPLPSDLVDEENDLKRDASSHRRRLLF